jgi:hypothetical protein
MTKTTKTTWYSGTALADALGIPEKTLRAMLRGKDQRSLVPQASTPRPLADLVPVTVAVILGSALKPADREAVIAGLPRVKAFRQRMRKPEKAGSYYLRVPASGEGPVTSLKPEWDAINIDLVGVAKGLTKKLESLAASDPDWAARHCFDVTGYVGEPPADQLTKETAADLRDLMEA